MDRDGEGIEPEADPESVDSPDEDALGREAFGSPPKLDSEGYQSDSAGYQAAQEYPWFAADADTRPDRSSAEAEDGLAKDWMPDSAMATAAVGTDGLEPRRRDWQVNVRLDRQKYGLLKLAADVYGTTPTALARMLLNRGSRAIINAHRAEMEAFEWADPRG
jgi:hypothetical protein